MIEEVQLLLLLLPMLVLLGMRSIAETVRFCTCDLEPGNACKQGSSASNVASGGGWWVVLCQECHIQV